MRATVSLANLTNGAAATAASRIPATIAPAPSAMHWVVRDCSLRQWIRGRSCDTAKVVADVGSRFMHAKGTRLWWSPECGSIPQGTAVVMVQAGEDRRVLFEDSWRVTPPDCKRRTDYTRTRMKNPRMIPRCSNFSKARSGNKGKRFCGSLFWSDFPSSTNRW